MLGLDKENVISEELPQLIIRDLSKEDLETIRANHGDSCDSDLVEGDVVATSDELPISEEDEGSEEEDEIIEINGREPEEPRTTPEGYRFVRGAR